MRVRPPIQEGAWNTYDKRSLMGSSRFSSWHSVLRRCTRLSPRNAFRHRARSRKWVRVEVRVRLIRTEPPRRPRLQLEAAMPAPPRVIKRLPPHSPRETVRPARTIALRMRSRVVGARRQLQRRPAVVAESQWRTMVVAHCRRQRTGDSPQRKPTTGAGRMPKRSRPVSAPRKRTRATAVAPPLNAPAREARRPRRPANSVTPLRTHPHHVRRTQAQLVLGTLGPIAPPMEGSLTFPRPITVRRSATTTNHPPAFAPIRTALHMYTAAEATANLTPKSILSRFNRAADSRGERVRSYRRCSLSWSNRKKRPASFPRRPSPT